MITAAFLQNPVLLWAVLFVEGFLKLQSQPFFLQTKDAKNGSVLNLQRLQSPLILGLRGFDITLYSVQDYVGFISNVLCLFVISNQPSKAL